MCGDEKMKSRFVYSENEKKSVWCPQYFNAGLDSYVTVRIYVTVSLYTINVA